MEPDDREVYPNAPLRFVAFEVRYPRIPLFEGESPDERIRRALQSWLPDLEPAPATNIQIGPGGLQQVTQQQRHRFRRLDHRLSATIGSETLTVETSEYERFEGFRDTVRPMLEALASTGEVLGILRLGLRYIDEIRVPIAPSGLAGWAEYIHPALTATSALSPWPIQKSFGLFESSNDAQGLAMRYGVLPEGAVVDRGGPIAIPHEDRLDSPCFFLDIDSFMFASVDQSSLRPLDVEETLVMMEALHAPTRALFEDAITDLAREIFRGQPKGQD